MLEWAGYEDKEAYRMLAAGFPIVGEVPDSLEFPPKFRAAEGSVRDLLAQSKSAKAAAKVSTRASSDSELDKEVWEATKKEIQEGWLRGPFSEDELDSKYQLWVPARRFGLRQGGKVRPVDDFS
eukprot:11547139-Heterocapsa_arctica.AAC.1